MREKGAAQNADHLATQILPSSSPQSGRSQRPLFLFRRRTLDRTPPGRATGSALAGRGTLERRLHVRQAFVRNEITTPKSRAGRRSVPLGDVAIAALEEQFTASRRRAPESFVFCHPALGTPLDPSKLTRFARKALLRAGVEQSFRPWHGLRHTALTETAAAGIPPMFVQAGEGWTRARVDD